MTIFSDAEQLILDTINNCLSNNISFNIIPKRSTRKSSGWVSEKEFVCCFYLEDGSYFHNLPTFIHESCHVDQIIDKSSVWHDPILKSNIDILDLITKNKMRRSKLTEMYFKKLIELELDCEQRSIEKIKKYNIDLDIENYTKHSNLYLFSYYCYYHLKYWNSPHNSIFACEDLIQKMPIKFLDVKEYWTKIDNLYNFIKKDKNS